MLYRLRDMLLSQRAYLTAMADYTAHGGKSRGSALYTDLTGGIKPFAQLPGYLHLCPGRNRSPADSGAVVRGRHLPHRMARSAPHPRG